MSSKHLLPDAQLDYLKCLASDLEKKGEVYSSQLLVRLLESHAALKLALTNARKEARAEEGLTTRGFALWCGVSPTQLCEWTGPPLPKEIPDFMDTPDTLKIANFQRNVQCRNSTT